MLGLELDREIPIVYQQTDAVASELAWLVVPFAIAAVVIFSTRGRARQTWIFADMFNCKQRAQCCLPVSQVAWPRASCAAAETTP